MKIVIGRNCPDDKKQREGDVVGMKIKLADYFAQPDTQFEKNGPSDLVFNIGL